MVTSPESTPLPAPTVPPEVYTTEYYATGCAGHEEWTRSGGMDAAGVYEGCLMMASFEAGEILVDIGTGRGEMLGAAIDRGAPRAIGIEYSRDALALAEQTIAVRSIGDRAEVVLADARRIPLDDGLADIVTLLDVVEHLSPDELHGALTEAIRLLRPGGRVFVHTMPNRLIYDATYQWLRRIWPGGRGWPRDPRYDHERLMHINEQTQRSLAESLRAAGFVDVSVSHGIWIYTDFVPSRRAKSVYHLLAKLPPTRRFGAGNLHALATRPGRPAH